MDTKGKYHYGNLVFKANKRPLIVKIDRHEVMKETVGQQLEITDIHPRLLYEGDIVRWHYKDNPKTNFIGVVVWNNIQSGFYIESKDDFTIKYKMTPNMEYEILGDIHTQETQRLRKGGNPHPYDCERCPNKERRGCLFFHGSEDDQCKWV
jgi:hypothetical protein